MRLRDYTPARVGLGRVGHSQPTLELLEFQLAHARARDAVHRALDLNSLALELNQNKLQCLTLASAAPSREVYLRRPDLGRRLNPASRERLTAIETGCEVIFVIADGLSALAVQRHAVPLLEIALPKIADWRIAPIALVEQGRVAIGDEIGELVKAKLSVTLIGERPGLSSPDSLGAYLTWEPRIGRTDAERNCISNIRAEGLSYTLAAHKLVYLMTEARRRRLSGVGLKDKTSARLLENA